MNNWNTKDYSSLLFSALSLSTKRDRDMEFIFIFITVTGFYLNKKTCAQLKFWPNKIKKRYENAKISK